MVAARTLSAALLVAALVGAVAALPRVATATTPKPVAAPCVKYWGEARAQAYGYKHIVHLDNQCPKPASCDVSTDVNPEVQHVSLDKGEQAEVVTFLESPAAAFVPKVVCTM